MASAMQTMASADFLPAMKRLGFRKKGLEFRWGRPGEPQVIVDLQSRSMGLTTLFVSVAIVPQPWIDLYEWFRGEPVGDLTLGQALFENRINPPPDVALRLPDRSGVPGADGEFSTHVSPTQEWTFETDEEAAHCGRRLTMKMEGLVPRLQNLLDPDALVRFVQQPGGGDGDLRANRRSQAMIVATMLAGRQPSEELLSALEFLRTLSSARRTVEWVELQQSKLT